MPRCSLKRLLVSFTLLAVGMFMVIRIVTYHRWTEPEHLIEWFVSSMMVGAGLFVPFRKTGWGVIIGLAIPVGLALLFAVLALRALNSMH